MSRLASVLEWRAMRNLAVTLLAAAALGLVAAAGFTLWAYHQLQASAPLLEGTVVLPGLTAPVVVERDELGVPTIRARGRLDVARVTGFLHAQERFFQMDLLRRSAAGELAALFGAAALPTDRAARVHRFRARSRRALAALGDEDRALIEVYAEGVGAGLEALAAPPFEYLLLGAVPEPWRPEDTGLTTLAMYLVLQDPTGARESALGVMHDVLPGPLFEFLAAPTTLWDAPIVGGPLPAPPIPGPEVFDLRSRSRSELASIGRSDPAHSDPAGSDPAHSNPAGWELAAGSNSWAVAGSLTDHGGALVADDMHLPLSVPNIWYRASFEYPDARGERRVVGVTLPGTPVMIVGSNGNVAWGFTNSQGDWSDLVVLEPDPDDRNRYRTPDGLRNFEHFSETLEVRDGEDEVIEVVETVWGPVIDRDHRGRQRAYRWVAHDTRAGNLEILRLESAESVGEALEIANRAGISAQNFTVGDREGHIAWTIIGPIPRRFGHDGQLPSSWADGSRGWDGWLSADEYPRVVDPASGRIWTANNRIVDGEMLAKIGPGAFVNGARARQIRDDLLAADHFDERDLLAIQLDDRALFLTPWRDLLLELLDDAAVRDDARRAELRRFAQDWGGRAAVDSVGYRMVRAFRLGVERRVFPALTARCAEADPRFDYGQTGRQQEGPLWSLVSERPLHLLDPRFANWDALLLDAVDRLLDDFAADGSDLGTHTWGALNVAKIRHPMSPFLPVLARWLDMPAEPLAGDSHMPRQQTQAFGVSERMVVAPGREEDGIFHMPTGQSAHPLSPFFGRGHEAWVNGEPTPLLPGPPVRVLRFEPAG